MFLETMQRFSKPWIRAREIERDCSGHGESFKSAANGRRGIAWVERPGPLATGDAVRLFVPSRRAWQPG